VMIPEGLDSGRIASIYSEKLNIDTQKFIGLVHDSSFAASIGDLTGSLEGFLFPDTYDFFWQQDESGLARRMVEHFLEVMPDSILKIHNNDPAGFRNAVTLASIIQGEAMIEEEMPTISAVYHNRLRRNMLLQADPTLQYMIADGPRRLTNEDKKIDSPYNTYLYPGLPPGPINNPGLSAILAAIHPADAPYLYFVANGDGTHTFTRSLSDHLRAKENLDRIRRDFHMKQKLRKEN
ncbi:MAG: endolytic transglycosylase MltG, partial [bacterium]